jgi:hypothetical protein
MTIITSIRVVNYDEPKRTFLTTHTDPTSPQRIPGTSCGRSVEKFPYFQSGQLLYFLSLLNEDDIHQHSKLKMAAAYAGNRSLLKMYVDAQKANSAPNHGCFSRKTMPAEITLRIRILLY